MRLALTRRTELALGALAALASRSGWFKTSEIARRLGTTATYLPHVLPPLAREGWIESAPGPRGGYRMVARLEDVSLLEVIEAVEGPTDDGRCVLADRDCPSASPCAVHDAWCRARRALTAELAATSVAVLEIDQVTHQQKVRK